MSFHFFAIYFENLSSNLKSATNKTLTFSNVDIYHRLVDVLRLAEHDECILFDQNNHAYVSLNSYSKKGLLSFSVKKVNQNTPLSPNITLYLGITRKDAFEQSMYYACQMGGAVVQPLITKKIQRSFGGDKEIERIKRIFISACEQSKNFIFPKINSPISIDQIKNEKTDSLKLYCHISGDSLFSILSEINKNKFRNIDIAVGPEGDFTDDECKKLESLGFKPTLLTPTILRSEDAVCVALGSIRSCT